MVFSSTKVANIGQQGKRALLFICIWLYLVNHHSDSSTMDYQCVFSNTDRHRKINQLGWQNMSAYLTNETSYWLKKFLMHLNWAIFNVCDLNIDPHVCFFPTLSQDRVRPIPLAQPEACPQRSERPVCAPSPHRSRNGYPGWRGLTVNSGQPLQISEWVHPWTVWQWTSWGLFLSCSVGIGIFW